MTPPNETLRAAQRFLIRVWRRGLGLDETRTGPGRDADWDWTRRGLGLDETRTGPGLSDRAWLCLRLRLTKQPGVSRARLPCPPQHSPCGPRARPPAFSAWRATRLPPAMPPGRGGPRCVAPAPRGPLSRLFPDAALGPTARCRDLVESFGLLGRERAAR